LSVAFLDYDAQQIQHLGAGQIKFHQSVFKGQEFENVACP